MRRDTPPVVENTTCCVVGGGPAGMVLGLLLARAGVDVVVLEKHADFLRDFRGDTIHPSTLEVLDELGLAERFHALPHEKARTVVIHTDDGENTVADFAKASRKFPYIAFVPQWDFLELMAEEARRYPTFRLRMRAEAYDLIREDGRVRGVCYRDPEGEHEVRAVLTVAADGRHSVLRRAAGLTPVTFGAPMDVLWFRLPRVADRDPVDVFARVRGGHMMVGFNRGTYWQLAYLVPKGGYAALRAGGIEALRGPVRTLLPFLADRVCLLTGYDQVGLLEVRVDRLQRWHRPGLLFIGDAAHAMSPIAGVGINLAVQDAVAAANLLFGPLRRAAASGADLDERLLAAVQRRRQLPTVVTQAVQRAIQAQVVGPVLGGRRTGPPRILRVAARLQPVRRTLGRFVGSGVRPEHVRVPSDGGPVATAPAR